MNDKLPPSLNRFAAELEQAIRRELGSRRDRRLSRVLGARPRLLAGTTVGAAGIATVLALVLSAAGSSPAFAVSRNRDGSVTVKIMRFQGIAGANARLAAMSVRARIVQVAAGCGGPVTARLAKGRLSQNTVLRTPAGAWLARGVRFDPRRIPMRQTLVIAASGAGRNVNAVAASTVSGAAPGCLPPAISAAQKQSFLANAQCMRTHGVPNLPDPTFGPGGLGISFNVPAGKFAHEAKAILRASKACANVGTPLPLGGLAGPACGQNFQPAGPGGPGNSGNSGHSGSGATATGSSGNSGSGNSGNSGNTVASGPAQAVARSVQAPAQWIQAGCAPPKGTGNSGNSGNSGSGNSGSGNSGSGNSGNS
ncbi:MAG: hypothetical protein ACLPTJ_16575 [Solirubrobacteraceae bacterium]